MNCHYALTLTNLNNHRALSAETLNQNQTGIGGRFAGIWLFDNVWQLCKTRSPSVVGRSSVIGCLHDPANVQHYICWKFAGSCKHPIRNVERNE